MRWWPFSFDLQEILLWTCSQEGLDLKNEEYVVFISYLGRAALFPFLLFLESLSTGEKLQLFSLGPIYLLPQEDQNSDEKH